MNRLQEALEFINLSLEIDPHNANFYSFKGINKIDKAEIYEKMLRFEESLENIDYAI